MTNLVIRGARAGEFVRRERPVRPGLVLAVLRVPGAPVAIAGLGVVMTIFSGFFFTLALHLQDGLGFSPLRAGLTFAPAAAAFALVSLNWRRTPASWHGALIIGGFVAFGAAMAAMAEVLRAGGTGGVALYLIGTLSGAGRGMVGGFVAFGAAMAAMAEVLRAGGTGGVALYLIGTLSGAGMAAAF